MTARACAHSDLQSIYTPEDAAKLLKESFAHVSDQWAQSHEDHSAATVATIAKVRAPSQPSVAAATRSCGQWQWLLCGVAQLFQHVC